MGLFNKKELEQISKLEEENKTLKNDIKSLKAMLERLGAVDYATIKRETDKLKNEVKKYQSELAIIHTQIQTEKAKLFDISEDISMQEFALYKPQFDCINSDAYKEKLMGVRLFQKKMIKDRTALSYNDDWVLDGSKSKGRAMNNDNMKMVLRAFNNECDAIIDKVKFNNFDKIKTQIQKSADAINKLNARNQIIIKEEYISLKLQELSLVHEFRQKKQEEKEAIREARAQEREQAKLEKEIIEARKKIEKEHSHYQTAKEKYLKELVSADESKKDEILNKIKDIDEQLDIIEKNIKDIDYREANQRAGYVYIISNIGSFGENIYKIGMTRRLEPQDRIDELGDASVPFTFDVHAMIFSDDAPALENALHKAFEDRKVNMVNGRKEFFNVTLNEIKEVVKRNHEQLIEIKDIPDAEQYRETLLLRKVKK